MEIGVDKDHVHFLIQSIPVYSVKKIVQTIKLWGGEFCSKGYFINTVNQFGSERSIAEYVKKQGQEKDYKRLHSQQLELFCQDTPQLAAG